MDPYQQNHNQPFMDDAMYQQFQQQQQPQYNEQNQLIPQPEVPHENQYEQQMAKPYVHQQPIDQQPAIMIAQPMPIQTQAVPVAVSNESADDMPTGPKGRDGEPFYCSFCRENLVSHIKFDMGSGSWFWVGLFSVLFFPVSCCPCCIKGCQDAIHECPQCGKEVGRNKFCD